MSCFLKFVPETSIQIPYNCDRNGVTYYEIALSVGPISWTVQHRYREFVDLNDRLIVEHGIAKDLLPPKKVIGNKSSIFLEQRQKQLELYLQKVLTFLQLAMCRDFVEFLDFNQYDIVYLLQDMAQKLFAQSASSTSSTTVKSNSHHEFTTLEMFAISSRLKMPCPITEAHQKSFDFSHVLDFCSQVRTIVVRQHPKEKTGNRVTEVDTAGPVMVGSSNIDPALLAFDLIAFRGLKELILDGVSPDNLTDMGSARETLNHLTVRNTTMTQINQILLCDSVHKDQLDTSRNWSALTHLDLSDNLVRSIDASIALLPKLQSLTLDHNRITSLAYLNQLPCLSRLELSQNEIGECVDCHLELGNIRTLNLSQNRLRSLYGFRKMYSLVALNVSNNQVADLDEVDHVATLPCMEELVLNGNPLATIVDYRAKVLSRYGDRASEIYLDNEKADPLEADTALVLAALRQSKLDPFAVR